jgi:hypothetical protein
MFAADPARILFTKDFRILTHGDLLPGRPVKIVYDADRLPHERSLDHGQKAWTIEAYYQFADHGSVGSVELKSHTGVVLHKRDNVPGEGTMMLADINIDPHAEYLSVWFRNTGKSGAQYWDSDFGRNYRFRFVVQDLHIDLVRVAPVQGKPQSTFHIDVSTRPEVSQLAVVYRIINDQSHHPPELRLPLSPQGLESGKRHWSADSVVSEGAVVKFSLFYTAAGTSYHDTNSGKEYLTWAGSKPNSEAGVL